MNEIETEKSTDISAVDESIIVKGNIDVLVIQKRLVVLVIESKSTKFDVLTALPQALAYMLGSPNLDQPCFGMIATGSEFIFVKLVKTNPPRYGLSKGFLMRNPGNELYDVMRILKGLIQIASL